MANANNGGRQYWARAIGCWARSTSVRRAFEVCKGQYYLKQPAEHAVEVFRLPDWTEQVRFSEADGAFWMEAPAELLDPALTDAEKRAWYALPGNSAVKVGEWKVRTPAKDVPEFED